MPTVHSVHTLTLLPKSRYRYIFFLMWLIEADYPCKSRHSCVQKAKLLLLFESSIVWSFSKWTDIMVLTSSIFTHLYCACNAFVTARLCVFFISSGSVPVLTSYFSVVSQEWRALPNKNCGSVQHSRHICLICFLYCLQKCFTTFWLKVMRVVEAALRNSPGVHTCIDICIYIWMDVALGLYS